MPHRTISLLCLALVAALGSPSTAAGGAGQSEPGAGKREEQALERTFRELPAEARRLTGPLFWLHGDESPERLREVLEKVKDGGNGCFTAESRPHSDWLGPGWYRDLEICLEAARQLDLKMWIFDERWWPSGEVAGRVPEQYASKRMDASVVDVREPGRHEQALPPERRIAVLAGRDDGNGIVGASVVDLADCIEGDRLTWDAPPGTWRIMTFTWWVSDGRGGRYLVDGASQDAVDWYLETVYQPHYDHFAEHFGKTIVGYFYDEPETRGDWGTEVIPLLKERGVDWRKALIAWKFSLAGPDQTAYRYQYRDALAEAWGRTLYGGITRWCHERGVQSIGHFLEHDFEYLDPELCAGNLFQLEKYTDMGGIDAVFRQFAPGTRDPGLWQTPKLGSSISHAYGKPDDLAMVEIFGARGQDLSYPEMKWWTDHMHVSGINFHIPHSFNPRAPFDRDCPPYFYHGGFEPRWPLYRVYADYTSRLSLMLSGGRHVCPVALLHLGHSAHEGKFTRPEAMSTALQDALYDCDWLPYEVFEEDTRIASGELALREERYRVLIVPPVELIPWATLGQALEFFEAGGVVLGYGRLPSASATPERTPAEIAALRSALWGPDAEPSLTACRTSAAGGRSWFLPENCAPQDLQQVLAAAGIRPTLEVVEGETGGWLHALHRVKDGRDVFFVCNQHHEGEARHFTLRVRARGVPECWDALRGTIESVPFQRVDDSTVHLDLTLEPLESALLVFQPAARPLPARLGADSTPVGEPLALTRREGPPPAPTRPEPKPGELSLGDCRWVWTAGGNPQRGASPGTCYFRASLELPAGDPAREAVFRLTADNAFVLWLNGARVGAGDNWQRIETLDLSAHLRPGRNHLALAATNGTGLPSPAGLVGRFSIRLESGAVVEGRIDATWKAREDEVPGWRDPDHDDSAWPPARELAGYGAGPWGSVGEVLTLSPVAADPFLGTCAVPATVDLSAVRVCLEMEGLQPEAAARITVNGRDAGGVIGAPLRLEITDLLRPGANEIAIEPFAPKAVRLVFFAR